MNGDTPDATGLTARELLTARVYETLAWLVDRRHKGEITTKELSAFVDVVVFTNLSYVDHHCQSMLTKLQKGLNAKATSA